MTYKTIHSQFKMNGFHFNENQLKLIAYSFIKEGEPYQKHTGNFILDWFDGNSFIDLQTSGTTGTPKIIRVEKQAMVNSALATGSFFDLQPSNKVLHCLPTNFIAGKMQFVRAFILGLDIDFVDPTSNPFDKNSTKYDFAAMVPLQVQNSIQQLTNIKKLIIGGTKINSKLVKELLKLKNIDIFETYGSTETVTHIAAKRVGERSFKALPNITINVNNKNCLIINAPKISNQEIITNDIVEIINETEFILLGRIDNVINSGGIKLFPEQIETKLSANISNRFFIIGIKDEILGEKVALIIEGEKYEIDDSIFDNLSKFEKPKNIIFITKFKETETGKILRKQSIE